MPEPITKLTPIKKNNSKQAEEQSENSPKKTTTNQQKTGNWLLQIVAFTCLLAVIIFFFQGLQPLILAQLVNNSQNQMLQINENYTAKVNIFAKLQADLTEKMVYNSALGCNQKLVETDLRQERWEAVQNELQTDTKLEDLPKYNVFGSKEVSRSYKKVLEKYKNNLNLYQKNLQDLKSFSQILTVRKLWTSSCTQIQNEANISKIIAICEDLEQKSQVSNWSKNWQSFGQSLENALGNCQKLQKDRSLDLGGWKLQWLESYEKMMQWSPNWSEINQDLEKANQQLVEEIRNQSRQTYNFYNQKTEFWGSWYLLDLG